MLQSRYDWCLKRWCTRWMCECSPASYGGTACAVLAAHSDLDKVSLSADCNRCDKGNKIQVYGDDTTYWMTGSLAKVFWGITGFDECDVDTDDYSCFNCQTCSNTGACLPKEIPNTAIDYTTGGMCGVAVKSNKALYNTRRKLQHKSYSMQQ